MTKKSLFPCLNLNSLGNSAFRLIEFFGISKTFSSNVGYIFLANLLNNLTIFIANIIIARKFGHEVFGLFSVAVNIALTTLMISEFGMNLTMIRFYKLHIDDYEKRNAVLFWNLYFKTAVFGGLLLIALLFSNLISRFLIQDKNQTLLIGIALLSGGVLGFWSYFKAYFQATNRFKVIAVTTLIYAILRLVFLGFFILKPLEHFEELLFLGVYIFPLFFVLFFTVGIFRREFLLKRPDKNKLQSIGKETFRYSKWVAISGITYVLIQKNMVFIVTAFGGLKQVSILSAALIFTAAFSLINDSVVQVLFPRMVELTGAEISRYRIKMLRVIPFVFIGLVVLMAVLSLVMIVALGEKYRASLAIFWIMGIGTALSITVGFYNIFLHTLRKPEFQAYVNISMLVLFSIACVFLIQKFGLVAVAIAYSITLLFGETIKALLVEKHRAIL
jgi:O-antigen/teichoic acid export membrane protein